MNQSSNNATYHTTYEDYGKGWLVNDEKSFEELGKDEVKLVYLEKCYKSMRRKEQMAQQQPVIDPNNEKYKYDKNAIISKSFPFKASEFKYPNDGQEKPKSLYITTNDVYGKIKPNDLELPEKYFPKNTSFTREQTFLMYRNNSLNFASSYSKVHSSLDSVV